MAAKRKRSAEYRVKETERMRAQYAENPAKLAEKARDWRAANPERSKANANARYARNRQKIREQQLARIFGISGADYQEMFREQNGVCAICGEPPGKMALAVDHDHQTGAVRGLLCGRCNMALGGFRDSPVMLAAALEYLK